MSGASSDEVRTFENVTNESRLIETQKPHQVRHTAGGVELHWFTPQQANHITETIERFNKQRPIKTEADIPELTKEWFDKAELHIGGKKLMGKLHEAALRIKAKKAELETEADKILSRLDGLDAKSPEIFDRAGKIIAAQSADIDAMDSELRQLSNLAST